MSGETIFWQNLVRNGEVGIELLCGQKMPETQHLEFKSKANNSSPQLGKEDRRNLGAALSGFSNAVGGVLIWGIEPAKNPDGETTAGKPAPIQQIDQFTENVAGCIAEYLSPPNPNIELHKIPSTTPTSGYLAIRISSSDNRPHMSMAPGDARYYQRVQASTRRMVDFQIRDMLRVTSSPQLTANYCFKSLGVNSGPDGRVAHAVMEVSISNIGKLSARHPYVVVATLGFSVSATVHFLKRPYPDAETAMFEANAAAILHPGLQLAAMQVHLYMMSREGWSCILLEDIWQRIHDCPGIGFELLIGCEDTNAGRFKIQVESGELEEAADALIAGSRHHLGGEAIAAD